jgi:hypothetical protein
MENGSNVRCSGWEFASRRRITVTLQVLHGSKLLDSFTRSVGSKLEGETADVTKREVDKILEERKDAGVPVAVEDETAVMEVDFGAPEAKVPAANRARARRGPQGGRSILRLIEAWEA